MSASAATIASLFAASSPFDWQLAVALLLGMGVGFFVVWAVTRNTSRLAHENAAELIEVARREAAVRPVLPIRAGAARLHCLRRDAEPKDPAKGLS